MELGGEVSKVGPNERMEDDCKEVSKGIEGEGVGEISKGMEGIIFILPTLCSVIFGSKHWIKARWKNMCLSMFVVCLFLVKNI